MSPACDADHLRVIALADDNHRVAANAVFAHELMDVRHMRAGRVDHGDAPRLALRVNLRRHAVGADDDRLPGLHVAQRIDAAHACRSQPLHLLRIVDERAERHAREPSANAWLLPK